MTTEPDNVPAESSPATQTPPLQPRASLGDENDAVLAAARQLALPIDAAPDAILTPKNFIDRFKFFDDGVDKKLYVWINGVWVDFGGAVASGSAVARMWLSASQSIPDGATTQVEFDSVSYEDGITADDSGNEFVVLEDGYYHINAQVLYGAPVTDTKIIGYIYVNGSIRTRSPAVVYNPSAGQIIGVQLTDTLLLSANDIIDIRIFHTYFTAPPESLQAGEEYTFCSIHKV